MLPFTKRPQRNEENEVSAKDDHLPSSGVSSSKVPPPISGTPVSKRGVPASRPPLASVEEMTSVLPSSSRSFTTTGPVVVALDDLLQDVGGRELDLEWRAIPDVNGLRVGGLNALREELGTLDDRLRDDRLPGRQLRVESELPGILTEVERRTLVSQGGVMLLTIQFAILAGYAILLVAGMLIERQPIAAIR